MAWTYKDSSFVNKGVTPRSSTIDLSASGNDRVLLCIQTGYDGNPSTTRNLKIDVGGGEEYETSHTFFFHTGGQSHFIAGWYILDANLPSAAGTYDVEVNYTLLDDINATYFFSADGVAQEAPELSTYDTGTTVAGNCVTNISPTAGALVLDGIVFLDNHNNGWASGTGQTETDPLIAIVGQVQTGYSYSTAESTLEWDDGTGTSADTYIHGYFSLKEATGAASVNFQYVGNR